MIDPPGDPNDPDNAPKRDPPGQHEPPASEPDPEPQPEDPPGKPTETSGRAGSFDRTIYYGTSTMSTIDTQRLCFPAGSPVRSVTLRRLDSSDVRYALAGVYEADDLRHAVERLLSPPGWVARLRFARDLVRLAIAEVDDIAVAAPYLEQSRYFAWNFEVLESLRIAFEAMHPADVCDEMLRAVR